MKKNEIRWWAALAILAVLYHIIIFALPFAKTPVFFISWLFTAAAMGLQILVIRTAFFQGEGIKSKFYGFPIAKIGAVYLAVQTAAGLIFMALGKYIPFWMPLVFCALLLGAAAIGLIAADAVREEVEYRGEKLQKDISRMRKYQSLTKLLAEKNQLPEAAEALKKLAEAFRFSDPVSSRELSAIEETLAEDLAKLQDAVSLLQEEETLTLCRKTERDLAERNRLCELHK